uniref:Odorant receptor n=1 Tax=Anoplophora chinensis TaxID=217632 RepID=A0A2H4ZB90_ANOCN|nr:odorant receptor [Anoplophora chinensis]
MYEITTERSFYSSLKILTHTYVIPKVKEGPQLFRFRFIFIMLRLASITTFVIMPCLHLIVTLRAKTGVDVSEDFSTMFGTFGCNVVTISFLLLYDKWSQFFIDLENCNRFGIPADIGALRKKLNLYSVLYALYTVFGVVTYGMIATADTSHCKKFNEEHGLNEICGTFTPLVLPFDGNPIFVRSLIFAIQVFLAMTTLSAPAVVCFMLYEGVETLIAYITLLKKNFINVFETSSEAERKDKLRFCVYFHDNMLSLCQRLSTLGKYSAGFLCMTCAVVFGCIGNLILKSKPVAGICYFLGYIAALFLLCHGGQRILDETLSVAGALYDSKWYDGDVQIMRDICFILARAQIPATLGALPLGVMNYPLFLMIMKTSYSYLTLLSQNT